MRVPETTPNTPEAGSRPSKQNKGSGNLSNNEEQRQLLDRTLPPSSPWVVGTHNIVCVRVINMAAFISYCESYRCCGIAAAAIGISRSCGRDSQYELFHFVV
ncbi:hypothetical protein SK128_000959, partial [Halocaridina rubra]